MAGRADDTGHAAEVAVPMAQALEFGDAATYELGQLVNACNTAFEAFNITPVVAAATTDGSSAVSDNNS